jgi:hypothetical protein
MEAPYGTWSSPIDGAAVTQDRGWTHSLVTVDRGDVYWSEARPLEDGRDAIVVRRSGAAPVDAIPASCSARTRVHEYGGGAFTVDGETVFFCHDADQRIHRVDGDAMRPITPEPQTRANGSSACASATAIPSTSTSSSPCLPTATRSPT